MMRFTSSVETILFMALVSQQVLADSVENSCQDFAWHEAEDNPPVVVTFLGVTLFLPDGNDNTPSPIDRDNPRVPNGTQQKGGGSPGLEHLSMDATHSRSILSFQLVHCPPTFLHGGWITGGSASRTASTSPGNSRTGGAHGTIFKVARPSGPDLRAPRQGRHQPYSI